MSKPTKRQLELIAQLLSSADRAKTALAEFFKDTKELKDIGKLDDPANALIHQVIKQALGNAGLAKLVENIGNELEAILGRVPRGQEIITEAFAISDFIVPAYSYKPVGKLKASMVSKDSVPDKLFILQAIVNTKSATAVESRWSGAAFDPETENGRNLLTACGGLMNVTTEPGWSVTKAKAN